MVTPVINNIAPFDAEMGTVVEFTYTGGITDSYIEIFNLNNTLIYDSRNDSRVGISQLKRKKIPSATEVYVNENNEIAENPLSKLTNNNQYYIQITVDNNGETSTSQKKLFRCITTPALSVYCNNGTNNPLENSYVLETAALELYAGYTQEIVDGKIYEDLNSYQFILYDNSYQIIYTSDVYYNLWDSDHNHVYAKISGLEEKRYFLKVIGKTIHGYFIENDLITIDVAYKSNTQKTTLYVENCYDDGLIKIGTNIRALLHRLGKSPADFIDDEIIDLKDNWLEYYDGLSITGDYLAYFRFRNPVYNTNLVRISSTEHNVYMNCYKHDTYMSFVELEETYGEELPYEEIIKSSELYFDLRIYTNDKVEMLVSDRFSIEDTQNKYFNAFIARIGSVYSFLIIDDKDLIVYNMTYELDGGENNHENPLTYKEDDSLTLYKPAKLGHTFLGWYSDKGYANEISSTFTAPKGNMTLYAKWEPNVYNIVYVDDGDVNTNPIAYTYGTTTTLSDASRNGYNFIGWYIDETFNEQITSISNTDIGDITLHAKWEPIQYTITYTTSNYNSIDGTITSSTDNPVTYYAGDTFELSDSIPNDNINYQFDGWYTNANCSDEYKITSVENQVGNLILYAKLSPKYAFKYTWYEDENGWKIRFSSLAATKDTIYIPAYFNGRKIIGCDSTTGGGHFKYQDDYLDVRYIKSAAKFLVDNENELFRTDSYGNLFKKEILREDGTISTGATLLHFCSDNKFTTSIFDNVSYIGSYAFTDCTNLTTIVIPDNISVIYDVAFFGCKNLSNIYLCFQNSNQNYCRRQRESGGLGDITGVLQTGTVNCTIFVKSELMRTSLNSTNNSFATVYKKKYIDSKQTISTDYDWEVPQL